MLYEIVSPIRNAQTIAAGTSVRDRGRLRRLYGRGRAGEREKVWPLCDCLTVL